AVYPAALDQGAQDCGACPPAPGGRPTAPVPCPSPPGPCPPAVPEGVGAAAARGDARAQKSPAVSSRATDRRREREGATPSSWPGRPGPAWRLPVGPGLLPRRGAGRIAWKALI